MSWGHCKAYGVEVACEVWRVQPGQGKQSQARTSHNGPDGQTVLAWVVALGQWW